MMSATLQSPPRPRPVIALVGRPNVGKSTLFNRLLGRRAAVVAAGRGTTRDRLYGTAIWRGHPWTFIDTGGMEMAPSDSLAASVRRQLTRALSDADGIVLLCDAQQGLVPADAMIMATLRKTGKPIVLAANKADHRAVVPPEFFALGVASPVPISALHGRGIEVLLDQVADQVGAAATPRTGDAPQDAPRHDHGAAPLTTTIALLGRQNVGKSSLLNALVREERAIVHDQPGTTRDLVHASLMTHGWLVHVLDTAGLRHRRKVRSPVDVFSMARTIEAIERCDGALLVLDATIGVTRDDQRIATRVQEAGRGLAILVNKWDTVHGLRADRIADTVHRRLCGVSFAPVIPVSAKTGFQVTHSLHAMLRTVEMMRRGLPESVWLPLLRRAWQRVPSGRFRGRAIHLQHGRWVPGRPTRLELVTRPVAWLPTAYQRYLLKQLYQLPQLSGVPIHLTLRTASD